MPIRPRSKKPACRSWTQFQRGPASEDQIRAWFQISNYGLAVVTGPVSGDLFVRDFDQMSTYDQWATGNPTLAETLPTVATSRGRHVYCRAKYGHIKHVDGGELRGGNGYCLLPPSIHPDGMPYRWTIPPTASIPLIDLCHSGFLAGHETERTERTEETESTERTEENPRELRGAVGANHENENLDDTVERIIRETVPIKYGTRNKAVFELARRLKTLPPFSDATLDELRPVVRRWHAQALAYIRTDPFEESWIDFIYAWPRIKFLVGTEPMTELFTRVEKLPDAEWPYEQRQLRLLASFCRELQRSAGDGPFYLSCRTAGKLLHVPHLKAWRWLLLLESDQWIVTVEKGSQDKHRATRFRYLRPHDDSR